MTPSYDDPANRGPTGDEPPFDGPPMWRGAYGNRPAHDHIFDDDYYDEARPASVSPQLAALHAWAGQRAWLGGVVTILGGLAIAALPNKGFTVIVLPGVAGLSGFVLGGLIIACGIYMLFSPHLHGILGIAAVLLSLVSFVTTNIGGYVIGLLLGIIGGSIGFAWVPPDPD